MDDELISELLSNLRWMLNFRHRNAEDIKRNCRKRLTLFPAVRERRLPPGRV
ncbi:hypothetical protein [Morganella morganii]|uniref:hypothetical protein n=1 Tax=Morganella morganii TaxID=582 RepID=UPI001D11B98E|nr:hypothetical protein [Morganella morganii]